MNLLADGRARVRFLFQTVLPVIIWLAAFASLPVVFAQSTPSPLRTNSWQGSSVFSSVPGAQQTLSSICSTPVPSNSVPAITNQPESLPGTYWSLQHGDELPPLPFNPFWEIPYYEIDPANQWFVYDDRGVDYAAIAAQQAEMAAANGAESASGPMMLNPLSQPLEALWLEIPPGGVGETNVTVMLHNTFEGLAYTMLTKGTLDESAWLEESIVYGEVGDSSTTVLQRNERTNLLIWSRIGLPVGALGIASQPLDQGVLEADMVTFSVVAAGNGNLTYQWTCNGTNIDGATDRSFTINSVQMPDAGGYAVSISDGTSSVTSRTAQLTVFSGTGDLFVMRIFGSRQDYSFKDGITYLINSPVQLYGNTVLKGGSVIKMDWYYELGGSLIVKGGLTCDTQPYYPAILTSVDDDGPGQALGYSEIDGPPQPYAGTLPFLDLTGSTSNRISNLRIAYADTGVTTPGSSKQLDVWNCQFMRCNNAIDNEVGAFGGVTRLHNVLFAGCGVAVLASTNNIEIHGEHVTADVTNFWSATVAPWKVAMANSLITGTLGSTLIQELDSVVVGVTNGTFSAVNAGNYYLPSDSPHRQIGTTNVSPALLAELRGKTTAAPMSLPSFMRLTGELTLAPQAPRYTNGAPDIGYYYDALDYTVANISLQGGLVTVLPGTAIGFRQDYVPALDSWTWWGFDMREGSVFESRGFADKPNTFVDVQFVQEQMSYACYALFLPDFFLTEEGLLAPTLDFRFSHLYASAVWYHVWGGYDEGVMNYAASPDSLVNWTMRDCELHGGRINLGNPDDGTFFGAPWDFLYGAGSISWNNNLFDNVCVNLDPTYFWYDLVTMNCDMRIEAANNLFRGGKWLRLEPVPATEGNWSFHDNLFDKADFLQDTRMPLDADYNGYWPKTPAEFLWLPSTAQLQPGTNSVGNSNEVVSTTAPAYQAGMFGNFYLGTNAPFFNAGSRTPADAGLCQYTTRPDQLTEGSEASGHKVNIGLHYVAATNLAGSYHAKDTDNDGIADYVEDADGNGDVGSDETSPVLASTDGVTNDTYNTAYDDIDLSGRGLVGRIKRALGIAPLSTANPLTLTQVTTGEEPDIATFQIPIAYDTLTNVGSLSLLTAGNSIALQECERATNGESLLVFNTTFETPGSHLLQLQFLLNGVYQKGSIPNNKILTAAGTLGTFDSTNVCQFDPFFTVFGSAGATLYAKLPDTNAIYTIELRTPEGGHIRTITNAIPGDVIKETWNLTDEQGNTCTNDEIVAVFNVTILDPASGTHTQHLYKDDAFFVDGQFTVAYAWDNTSQANGTMRDCIQWGVVDQLLKPTWAGGGNPNLYSSTFNDFSSVLGSGMPGFLPHNAAATTLIDNLGDPFTRNFHFDGHGSPKILGDDNVVTVDSQMVANKLNNSWSPRTGFKRKHAFRFVFLNACETARLPRWAHIFGIPDSIKADQLADNPSWAQAFLGWVGSPRAADSDDEWRDVTQTYTVFYAAWMSNQYPLAECIKMASNTKPFGPSDPTTLNFPFGKKFAWGATHYKGKSNDFELKVYGYRGIKRIGFDPNY
jgi:hypothetical protein